MKFIKITNDNEYIISGAEEKDIENICYDFVGDNFGHRKIKDNLYIIEDNELCGKERKIFNENFYGNLIVINYDSRENKYFGLTDTEIKGIINESKKINRNTF